VPPVDTFETYGAKVNARRLKCGLKVNFEGIFAARKFTK